MVAPRLGACSCGGTGVIADDGSITDMPGWPLPCPCIDSVPRQVRALMCRVQAQRVIIHHDHPASPDPTAAVAAFVFRGEWVHLALAVARLACFVTPRELRSSEAGGFG